jgi:hypothetical protein
VKAIVTLDTRPPAPPIDPAKRFVVDRTLRALRHPTFLLEGPLVLTKASWNEDAGDVTHAIGHCERDFRPVPIPDAYLLTEIEKGRSLCALPNSLHVGGDLVVHLEGYRK